MANCESDAMEGGKVASRSPMGRNIKSRDPHRRKKPRRLLKKRKVGRKR